MKNQTKSPKKHKGAKASGNVAAKTSPIKEDKRNTAREEHTNHFTNRAPAGK